MAAAPLPPCFPTAIRWAALPTLLFSYRAFSLTLSDKPVTRTEASKPGLAAVGHLWQ